MKEFEKIGFDWAKENLLNLISKSSGYLNGKMAQLDKAEKIASSLAQKNGINKNSYEAKDIFFGIKKFIDLPSIEQKKLSENRKLNEKIREQIIDIANILTSTGAGVKVKKINSTTFEFHFKPGLPEKETKEAIDKLNKKYPEVVIKPKFSDSKTTSFTIDGLKEEIKKQIEAILKRN